MKLKNLSRWELSEEMSGLLFFAQRMDELLFDFSLDSHKAPALNAPYLCIEAVDLISEIENGFMEVSNLEPVLEELRWSLQNDSVAKTLLDADSGYYTLRNDETPLSQTRLRLEVLGQTINPNRYLAATLEDLREAVVERKKKKIDQLATTMLATLVNMGVSKQAIFSTVNAAFFDPNGAKIDSLKTLDDFIKEIVPRSHDFDGYVLVSSLIKEVAESIYAFRMSIVDALPDDLEIGWSIPPNESEVLIKLEKIKAPDAHAARSGMVRRLDALSDLFTLFYHRDQIRWRDESIVIQTCCDKSALKILPPKGPMEKAFDLSAQRASKQLNALLRNFSARRDVGSFQRFNRVVDLHGVCVTHKVVDNQLVNLWTALETLVPSHVGGSKINKVVRSVVPFIQMAYVRRLVEQLLRDLLVWDKWRTSKLLYKVPIEKGSSFLERLTALIAAKECGDLRNDLYVKLGDFHLLRYRCFRLAEQLSSKDRVFSLLDSHERKVGWQVRRLYRARNLIVHTSKSPSYLETLVTNGHDYLDQVTFDVIRVCSGEYSTRTIEQAFELGSVFWRGYKNSIPAGESFSVSESILITKLPAGFITEVESKATPSNRK